MYVVLKKQNNPPPNDNKTQKQTNQPPTMKNQTKQDTKKKLAPQKRWYFQAWENEFLHPSKKGVEDTVHQLYAQTSFLLGDKKSLLMHPAI